MQHQNNSLVLQQKLEQKEREKEGDEPSKNMEGAEVVGVGGGEQHAPPAPVHLVVPILPAAFLHPNSASLFARHPGIAGGSRRLGEAREAGGKVVHWSGGREGCRRWWPDPARLEVEEGSWRGALVEEGEEEV